ncbi:hypothetical protein LWI28_019116 [Acer negundo]|uniref:Rx N-terminal domain-containing protein n=1 Tax=Acer negundo TaxID=4023 RepID=A0AAD5NJA0_ACENE|nr:hypothetical protein LWI28_019116 [Acer negundo]
MATDILVSPIVDLLLGKLGPLAYQQVSLMYGVEKDLEKLRTTLTTIKNGLLDTEKQQLHSRQVGDWLEKLKDVCYDAEDVFDEFQAEALRRQVLAERGSIPKKVSNALSWPKSLAFRFNIGHKIKEIRERLDEIAKNQTNFGFKNIVENRINYIPRQRETHSFVVPSEIIGLLQSCNENEELEKIGLQYLKELLSRSFFQDFEEMVGDHVFSFKMHDLMHDLALSIVKNECAIVDTPDHFISKKARHLLFVEDNMIKGGVPSCMSDKYRLRTILFPYNDINPSQSFVESCISMFPFLRFLDLSYGSIVFLPKKLGNLRHLRYLNLANNGKIKKVPNSICKLQSLQTLSLVRCEELQELPRDMRYLISLRLLEFTTNQKFLPHNGIGCLDSLRTLSIYSCMNLEYLVEDISNLKVLRTLVIGSCPNLVSLPNSIKRLSSLEELYLQDCEKLNLDWGMGMEEENTHQDLNGTRPHLRLLVLSKLPKLVELPQWLLRCSANTLQLLRIQKCPNLLALPDSLQILKQLRVWDCPKVASLPQDMHCLTTLEKIEIEGCPTLSERCQQGSGEDWPQIAHVPNIRLDGHLIIK